MSKKNEKPEDDFQVWDKDPADFTLTELITITEYTHRNCTPHAGPNAPTYDSRMHYKLIPEMMRRLLWQEASEKDVGEETRTVSIEHGMASYLFRFCRGKSDPLHCMLTRRGLSFGWATVEATPEEVSRLSQVLLRSISDSSAPYRVEVLAMLEALVDPRN